MKLPDRKSLHSRGIESVVQQKKACATSQLRMIQTCHRNNSHRDDRQETETARTSHCSSKSDLYNLPKTSKSFYNITNWGPGGIQNMSLWGIFQTLSGTSKPWKNG